MAIRLTNGFELIPEGLHVLKIVSCDKDKFEDFGKLVYTLSDAKGRTMDERFYLTDGDGNANPKAMAAFSFFAKTAMGDMNLETIEPEDLVEHYIKCEIIHNKVESRNNPGRYNTFANLGREKDFATGFDFDGTVPEELASKPNVAEKKKPSFNLNDILG